MEFDKLQELNNQKKHIEDLEKLKKTFITDNKILSIDDKCQLTIEMDKILVKENNKFQKM